MWKNTLDQMTL